MLSCHLFFSRSEGAPSTLSQKDKVPPLCTPPLPQSQQLLWLAGVLHVIRVCSVALVAVAGLILQLWKSLASFQRAALPAS